MPAPDVKEANAEVESANKRYQDWIDANKAPTCQSGYICNCFNHYIHITEVVPMLLLLVSVIMFIMLVSGLVDIQSVIFAGLAMGTSGVSLILFWNYKSVLEPRRQADYLEAHTENFEKKVQETQKENKKLMKKVAELESDCVNIEADIDKIGKQLGILSNSGKEITGVVDGYNGYLESIEKLREFRTISDKIQYALNEFDAGVAVSQEGSRIKRDLREVFLNVLDDEGEGVNVSKEVNGEYENKEFQNFVEEMKKALTDHEDLCKSITSTMASWDSDGDGTLTEWEFMIAVDREIDKWSDMKREEILKKKLEKLEKEKRAKEREEEEAKKKAKA
mmetsp:Transcript_23282/g.41191  ORF Transcript_23282/g.41191 Transcript_23282/m.41191 type:complete len:335 (+) Transcript_23282:101-1105(+)|eukprot:CAMPEP_0197525766 /NCGR_PEP_ID=MMETSP1318-20131121/14327_1 /TAXON_ID=552666 /ORGANISM="Partenskyella glossopodia, Strain RCC365" /LENGTH=334 /DNA_ID=CAMNT_0043079495 /DNA_START=101 /DNA_END=1105 /DNA_ORIENTATION=-